MATSRPQTSELAVHDQAAPRWSALDVLLLLFLLNVALQPLVEPDFGWHLRTGLDLLAHGWRLPITDPYSHTMGDWLWVEHAWLTDGVLALLYTGFGRAGALAVILAFGGVIAAAFVVAASTGRTPRPYRLAAAGVAAWVGLPFLGARIQMITLLGVALILVLWRRIQSGERGAMGLLPPLFLLWANLHGGFTAGLFVLMIMLGVSVVTRMMVDRNPRLAHRLDEPVLSWADLALLAGAVLASALVTFINPYGWHLHREIALSLSDRLMIETLQEWQPVSSDFFAGRVFMIYVGAIVVTTAAVYRRLEPVRAVLLLTFLALAWRYWRNVPLFLIVSAPFVAERLCTLVARLLVHVPVLARRVRIFALGATVVMAGTLTWLGSDHLERVVVAGTAPAEFLKDTEYPIEAIQWIREHRDSVGSRLFNDYGFGGFLLWWLPEEKIFIDGRMPAWRIGDRWIFYDYLAVTHSDPPRLEVLDKYAVDWVMTKRGGRLEQVLRQDAAWRTVYEDRKVAILVRT